MVQILVTKPGSISDADRAAVGRPMFDPKDKMGATGIREVIDWAKSPRGKYQKDQPDLYGGTCEDAWCGS